MNRESEPMSEVHACCSADRDPEGGASSGPETWLDKLTWDEAGLMPAIAQDALTNRILMVAWMNRESLAETVRTGRAVYWSRSRQRLWRKGEESGNQQVVREIRTDCDADVILLKVEQRGGVACHTGRESCFFNRLTAQGEWEVADPVRVDPATLYGQSGSGG
ncbi:MAG: phosphoribosyl-AMP cyclohydrolase [Lautropia sp.]|nr:phosphoribosyl-AMP cyclohydrolase [Lautropia sp.]